MREPFGSPRLLTSGLFQVTAAAAGGTLWIANRPPAGPTVLLALDARTGAVRARQALGAVNVNQVLYAEGWLWLTTDSDRRGPARPRLWRLDPGSLAVLSTASLSARLGLATVASAGGSLWVGDGGVLDQATAIGGRIVRRVRIPGARLSYVATGPGGRSLLVSEGNGSGLAHVQRRSATFGRLLAQSRRFLGVTAPQLGGTSRGRVWISQSTGMAGYIEQLSVRTLRPTHATIPFVMASNGVQARVIDGILWVTQPDGGVKRNYCANPVTGQPRAALPGAVRPGRLLTADVSRIYYLTGFANARLWSLAIPAVCR